MAPVDSRDYVFLCGGTRFYPSARWALGVLSPPPFVRSRLRHRRTQSFGYYTNLVQQILFKIHTNIQPLPALFTQGQGHRFKSHVR